VAPQPDTLRCFVACWPDDDARTHLDELAQALHARFPGARRMRAENLHLTLAFIGPMPAPGARQLASALPEDSIEPFGWRIDRIGRFERARVLWAGSAEEPRLSELAAGVRRRLRTLQIAFDDKPFAAHVTLLRDLPTRAAGGPGAPFEPIGSPLAWQVRSAQLVVSDRDERGATRYRLLQPA